MMVYIIGFTIISLIQLWIIIKLINDIDNLYKRLQNIESKNDLIWWKHNRWELTHPDNINIIDVSEGK